jgi:hypothetical protein
MAGTVGVNGWGSLVAVIFTTADTIRIQSNNDIYLVTNAVFRDPTAWLDISIVCDTTQASASNRLGIYVNNVLQTYSTDARSTYIAQNSDSAFSNTVPHEIGRVGSDGNFFDGYRARVCFVGGTALTPSSFGYQNTEINEWVAKSQSAVKAVVDAGGTNSFMLDFDDATSLTTLGYDKSSKGNNWTLNNFSLTAGTTYDHMLDVPGNSFAMLNSINKVAAHTMSNGNLYWAMAGGTGYMCRSTMAMESGKWVAEVTITAGTTQTSVGVVSSGVAATADPISVSGAVMYYRSGTKYVNGSSSAYGASFTTGDLIRIELNMDGTSVEFFKNGTSQGSIALGTTGLAYCFSGADANFLATQLDFCFGQAPLHASSAYRSAAGGYFVGTPSTGFKALCQANLPTPAILNPKAGFVSVIDTEANIYATLAAARSGWTDYVDVLKNRDAAESWAWQFSHDSSNEYAVAASSLVRQTKRTQSGSQNWYGESIRIGATYGTAAGSVSHTNGAATTITHNIGKSSRQMILLFNRAGGTTVPMYHADLTAGTLLNLCSTANEAAGTSITSVLTNSFQIGSATATGTYDYLVISEISGFFKLFKYIANGNADGPYADLGMKARRFWAHRNSGGADHFMLMNTASDTYNVADDGLRMNTNDATLVGSSTLNGYSDIDGQGVKVRTSSGTLNNSAGVIYVGAAHADVAGKYALGR